MIPKITQKVPALWNSIGVGTVAPASPIQVNFGGKCPRNLEILPNLRRAD